MLSFGRHIRKINKKLSKHGLSSHTISLGRRNRKSKRKSRSKKSKRSRVKNHRRRNFGSTEYQQQVNSLTGALGPTKGAFWQNTSWTTGQPYKLAAHPLNYSPINGIYVTASSTPAAQGSINFGGSFGFGRKRRCGTCGGKGTFNNAKTPKPIDM